ncbi:hypothetical protein PCASD_14207 [Puccinia coronata f. sp. avenae]|uniref:Uncharacterized protein n=1 Tax=Puccinia coronata f. sp. avenae TaxID=200324 RepID=A0A2N5U3J1_9BASI|nr:hypothetical protein PCASD_14207 [Puccinia coronata f. sp. avenae]
MADTSNNPNDRSADGNQTADSSDLATAKDWFKKVLKAQHASIDNANCIGCLEELLLAMNIKNEGAAQTEIEPFLHRIHGVQIFFGTKDVIKLADKIKIVGNLIAEINLQSFYANKATGFFTKSWEEFKTRLFDFALPTNWKSGLFKFDALGPSKLADLQLAQFLVYGLPDGLQDRVNKRQLLETVLFAYGPFEKQVNASFLALQRPTKTPAAARLTPSAPPSLARDDFIWRVHLYLDLRGLCHFCKKHCGSAASACPGPLNRSHVDIPSSFVTPAKPPNYSAPRAWNGPPTTPGRPTQAPAGHPSACAASVAGIADTTPLEVQVAGLTVDAVIREDACWDSYFDDKG